MAADGSITLDALLAATDGGVVLTDRAVGTDPEAVGRAVALGLLDRKGGRALFVPDG
jgi:hypothetical protein